MTRRTAARWTTVRTTCLATLLVGLAVAAPAFAQIVDIPAILDADVKAPPTVATFQYGHQFGANVEDRGTEIARDTAFFGLAHRVALGEKTTLIAVGNYTLHAYDFSGGSAPQNRYRWDDMHRLVLGGIVGHDVNDRWRILGGALFRSWGETGAEYGKSITGGVLGGFDYHPNDDFSVGLIVGLLSELESGVGLIPVPTMKWNISKSLRFNAGMIQLVDPGVGAQLTYQITPEVALGTGFAYQSRQYRLADNSRVTGRPNHADRNDDGGVGQETELPIFALVRWRPTQRVELDVHGGVAVGGHLRLEDRNGGRIVDDDYDPAGILGFKGQFFF